MLENREATVGLFSIDGSELAAREDVDARVVAWARQLGAAPEHNSELLEREDLHRIDYFDSFPHLAHRCYGVYFRRRETKRPQREIVTVRVTCRRREERYEPLRRQREFQMREVVAIGTADEVEAHLRSGAEFMADLAGELGIEAEFEVATDPFFRRDDPRARHQQLFPTKRELVDSSGLAIGSINFHRNFFGERCEIERDGEPVFSGCVAFGLERWVDAIGRATRTPPPSKRSIMSTSTPGPTVTLSTNGAAAPTDQEIVGGSWARRLSVSTLWAAGMNKPMVARAFWRAAYGTDYGLFIREWERLADEPAGTRILDLPTGGGVCLLGLAPETPVQLTAADISEDMLRRVRERADAAGLGQVDTVAADATALPFDDESFDLVVTYNGLHCFNQPWAALSEMHRVLAPGGRIRGTTLLRRPGVVAPRVQRYFQWRNLLGTIGTWAEMQSWCASAGLAVERTGISGALVFFEGTRDDERG
jgi:SAM-dependent methyltransferase